MKIGLLVGLFLILCGGLFGYLDPIAQDVAYHNFADKRPLLNLPNCFDVISNLAFLIPGGLGIRFVLKHWGDHKIYISSSEKSMWLIFFMAVSLVAIGSGYYHLAPNNYTLVWDRLPMTLSFTTLFSIVISERVSKISGIVLLPIFLIAGLLSVGYWHYTELSNQGDLRPYIMVQFFPIIGVLYLVLCFQAPFNGNRYVYYAVTWYVAAKVFESYDKLIFVSLNGQFSGHSLKHFAAAIAVFMLYKYLAQRKLKNG